MRNIIIAGNWKMNKNAAETEEFCRLLSEYLTGFTEKSVQPIIAPVSLFLAKAAQILAGSPAAVSAQDVSAHDAGAFTGEISSAQLKSIGIKHCIVGHSERRQYHRESDSQIREKIIRLWEHGITPIVCVGETLSQREDGETAKVVLAQLAGCFDKLELPTGNEAVVAYEPVWAIGTGRTATAEQAAEVHALIRGWFAQHYGKTVQRNIRILYGGSVKVDNIGELLAQPDIDGGLIGGASLAIGDFCKMIDIAVETAKSNKDL